MLLTEKKVSPVILNPLNTQVPERSPSVLQKTTHFGIAVYLSKIFCALRGLMNAKCLGPEWYGFWGSLSFLISFGFHLHGGVQDAMVRQIPALRSQGNAEEANRVIQSAFSFFFILLSFAALVILFIAFFFLKNSAPLYRIGWMVAALALPLEALYFFEQNVLRSKEEFQGLNRGLILTSFLSLLLTAVVVVRFQLAGLFCVALLTPAFGLFYLHRRAGYAWRLGGSFTLIKALLSKGWPILTMTLVFESLWWVDRVLVLAFFGMKSFGYYALGMMVMQFCYLLPQVVASVMEPKMYYDYEKEKKIGDIHNHLWYPLKTLAIVFPVMIAALNWLLPILVLRFFPAYEPGIPAMKILMWGSLFVGLMVNTKAFILTLHKQKEVLGYYLVAAGANLVCSLYFVSQGWGLSGVALGTVCGFAVGATGLLLFVFQQAGEKFIPAMTRVGKLYGPCLAIYLLTVVAAAI